MYHQNVDSMGHYHGPGSDQVREAVEEVDRHLDELLDEIATNGPDDLNVIVVSDHGMTSVDPLHKINISEVLDMGDVREITEGGTQAYIWPMPGREEKVWIFKIL